MTAKEYLRQIRRLDEVINAKLEQVDELRSMAEKITGSPATQDGVRSGGEQDKVGSLVAKLVDLWSELYSSVDQLLSMRQHALEIIKTMPDNRHKTILIHYYFNRKTWEQIAVDMHYTYRWVLSLHGQALVVFEENFKSPKRDHSNSH